MNSLTPKLDVLALREEWRKHPEYGCWWSSPDNEKGLQLTPTIQDGKVWVDMKIERHHSGFPGIAHGGVAFTILDGLMGWWLMAYEGRAGFTSSTQIDYKAPLTTGKIYRFEADTEGQKTPSGEVPMIGKVYSLDNLKKPLVKARANFFLPDRATAEKVLGMKIGEIEGKVFPEV